MTIKSLALFLFLYSINFYSYSFLFSILFFLHTGESEGMGKAKGLKGHKGRQGRKYRGTKEKSPKWWNGRGEEKIYTVNFGLICKK